MSNNKWKKLKKKGRLVRLPKFLALKYNQGDAKMVGQYGKGPLEWVHT
jgi:hypothetical protein